MTLPELTKLLGIKVKINRPIASTDGIIESIELHEHKVILVIRTRRTKHRCTPNNVSIVDEKPEKIVKPIKKEKKNTSVDKESEVPIFVIDNESDEDENDERDESSDSYINF